MGAIAGASALTWTLGALWPMREPVQTINIPDFCTLLALSDNYITVGMGSVFIHIEIEDYSIQPMPLKVLDGMHRPPTDVIVLNDEFILTCHRMGRKPSRACAGARRSRAPRGRRRAVRPCPQT